MGGYHEETSQSTYKMNQATEYSLRNRNLAITIKRDAYWTGSNGKKSLSINHAWRNSDNDLVNLESI